MDIRDATGADFTAIWPIFRDIVRAGETYGFARDTSKEKAHHLWMELPERTFVAEDDDGIVGTYFLKANQAGPGAHVCNCGYMVAPAARGKGVATAMCEHSQGVARALGYKAMQFNYVAESNAGAARLWQHLGFQIVGTVPKAFEHPTLGYVGAHVMYKWLEG
ncbi:MAG: GNAT family N-acetyltransferase [Pseudomonadota bacterium]